MDTTIFGNLHISSDTSPAHLGNTSSSHLQLRERTRYPVSAVLPILLKIHTRFVTHSLRKKDMNYLKTSGFWHTNAEKMVWLVELISFAINQLWKKLLICIDQVCGVQTSRGFHKFLDNKPHIRGLRGEAPPRCFAPRPLPGTSLNSGAPGHHSAPKVDPKN